MFWESQTLLPVLLYGTCPALENTCRVAPISDQQGCLHSGNDLDPLEFSIVPHLLSSAPAWPGFTLGHRAPQLLLWSWTPREETKGSLQITLNEVTDGADSPKSTFRPKLQLGFLREVLHTWPVWKTMHSTAWEANISCFSDTNVGVRGRNSPVPREPCQLQLFF